MGFTNWLGIETLNQKTQTAIKNTVLITGFRSIADNMFIITAVLYFLDTLEPIQVGLVWSAFFLTQAILDYPTGNLGDAVGYKNILLAGYSFQILAVPLLIFDDKIIFTENQAESILIADLIFMILYAIGKSQESGALEAWFDNNYKQHSDLEDADRDIYKKFQAKASLIYNTTSILGFLSGGFIATILSRTIVFSVFLLIIIVTFILIFTLLPADPVGREATTVKNYLSRVRRSFGVFLNNPVLFTYFVGIGIIWAANGSIWFTFIMFRLYEGYTGSDAGAGIIRGLVYFTSLLWQILVIKFIHRFKRDYFWVFVSAFVSNTIFFTLILIYQRIFPPTNFELLIVLGFLLIYQIPASLEALQHVLQQRINLDLIPDEYRNSLYSLVPTIVQFLGVLFVVFTGLTIDRFGFESSFYVLIGVSFIGSIILGISFRFAKHHDAVVILPRNSEVKVN